jgi:hypothetical protein
MTLQGALKLVFGDDPVGYGRLVSDMLSKWRATFWQTRVTESSTNRVPSIQAKSFEPFRSREVSRENSITIPMQDVGLLADPYILRRSGFLQEREFIFYIQLVD